MNGALIRQAHWPGFWLSTKMPPVEEVLRGES
jgi:hypothetical protein